MEGREGSQHFTGWMERGGGQLLPGKMHRSSKKQATVSRKHEVGRHAGWRTQTAWTLPCPGGWASSAHPFTRKVTTRFGERSRITWDVSVPAREPEEPPRRPMAPCLPEPSCSHAKATGGGPGSPSSLHSQQTRHEQTKPRLTWSLPSSRGAARRPGGGQGAQKAQVSPGYI